MLAIQQGKDTFNFSNHNYTMNKVSDEMFTISCDGVMVGYAARTWSTRMPRTRSCPSSSTIRP